MSLPVHADHSLGVCVASANDVGSAERVELCLGKVGPLTLVSGVAGAGYSAHIYVDVTVHLLVNGLELGTDLVG